MNNLSIELQSIIVFVSQIVFVYLRTINVKAIAEEKLFLAITSGSAQGISGLISLAIGVYSIIDFQLLPILSYLIGGAAGIYFAMQKNTIMVFPRKMERKLGLLSNL